ncbi:hypothetical protein ACO0LO_05490 [Undibacterium sp. TJN25]|uniref:hypothetical protein n=1 Tax=Undibacterium sp. TJN25 TaxID=3413056 RepID=UPI003BF01F43
MKRKSMLAGQLAKDSNQIVNILWYLDKMAGKPAKAVVILRCEFQALPAQLPTLTDSACNNHYIVVRHLIWL